MNKKILVGLSVFGVVAAFWACGDGAIEAKSDIDSSMLAAYPDSGPDSSSIPTKLVQSAVADCEADDACKAAMEKSEGSVEVPESSGDNGGEVGNGGQGGEGNDTPKSSASGPVSTNSGPVSNSSTTPTGSSGSGSNNPPPSSTATATNLSEPDGFCEAKPASVTKGEPVTLTFTGATVDASSYGVGRMNEYLADKNAYDALVNGSTCAWTIEGGTVTSGNISGTCGGDGKSITVTYAEANKTPYTASIKLGEKTIPCNPSVKVNGKAIKGCVCETTTPVVDIVGKDYPKEGAWSVACTDASNDPIVGYTWDNDMGTSPTATHTFTAAKQTLTPKVTVSTAESDTTITCPSPKVIDGNNPETNIQITSETITIKPGIYKVTSCSGGGQLCCFRTGDAQPFTWDGSECTAVAGDGWGSCGSGSCKAGDLETTVEIQCHGCW